MHPHTACILLQNKLTIAVTCHRIGIGLCKGNILQELENWGFYLNTLGVSAAGHPSGEVPMPARGAVIKSLRSQSVSGPNFIVIRQTAHPLGQQRVGHYILGKAQN